MLCGMVRRASVGALGFGLEGHVGALGFGPEGHVGALWCGLGPVLVSCGLVLRPVLGPLWFGCHSCVNNIERQATRG